MQVIFSFRSYHGIAWHDVLLPRRSCSALFRPV